MAHMKWSDELSTGIAEQDDQHRTLIELINRLSSAIQDDRDTAILTTVLTELVDYTVYHFGYEEELMDRHGYADTPAHKSEHEMFIVMVHDFKQKFSGGDQVISAQVIHFLRMWVTGHIMQTDKKMGQELGRVGVT